MTKWTKKMAIERAEKNILLQEILKSEPDLISIIDEAKKQKKAKGYNRIKKYIELRNKAIPLVGWKASNEQIRTSEHYDAVIRTIDDLLPPDDVDLADY
jgi:hypothetical protein